MVRGYGRREEVIMEAAIDERRKFEVADCGCSIDRVPMRNVRGLWWLEGLLDSLEGGNGIRAVAARGRPIEPRENYGKRKPMEFG